MLSDKALVAVLVMALAFMACPGAHSAANSALIGDTFANVEVASCSEFAPLTKAAEKSAGSAAGAAALVDTGSAMVIVQLEGNCTGSYASYLEVSLTFKLPGGGVATGLKGYNASVHTGTCKSGGGSLYLIDPASSRGSKIGNILRVWNISTEDEDGDAGTYGTGGLGIARAEGSGTVAKSVLIYNQAGAPISCCDLTPSATASESDIKAALGRAAKVCKVDDNTPGVMVNGKWEPCTVRFNYGFIKSIDDYASFCTLLRNGTKLKTLADGTELEDSGMDDNGSPATSGGASGGSGAPPGRTSTNGTTSGGTSSNTGGTSTIGAAGTSNTSKNNTSGAAAASGGGKPMAAVMALLAAVAAAAL